MGIAMKKQPDSLYYTPIEAAAALSVDRRTIYNWMASGKVQYVRTAGGSVRIFTDTLWRSPELPRDRWVSEPVQRGA